MQKFNLKKLNDVEVKEEYQVMSHRFAIFENLGDDDVDINRAWGGIRQNLKASTTDSRLL